MALEEYRRKRDFTKTPEPSGEARAPRPRKSPRGRQRAAPDWHSLPAGHRFCVQQHRATRMHFDFRLEHDGVLLSWAIPRGPTLDPAIKRLAVQTEDHPIDYGDFEGVIPSGYGAGTVLLWDIGTYEWTRESAEDFESSRARGDIKFRLSGTKIAGEYALIHIGERGRRYGGSSDGEKNWLLIKKRDEFVVEKYEAVEHGVSVKSGRSLAEIASAGGGDPREAARAARASGAAPRAPAASRADVGGRGGANTNGRAAAAPRRAVAAAALPAPMLATGVDRPFTREGWLFELKWDGVRALAAVDHGAVTLVGRRGRDETSRYPELAAIGRALRGHSAVVDGEIVVMDADGRPSFERLQSRINVIRESDVRRVMREHPATYVVFDILRLDGRDLLNTALRIRKKTLGDVLTDVDCVLYADHVEREGEKFFAAVTAKGIEGMIAKRADSMYQPGRRSPDWVKVKSWLTQTCVIAGWTGGRGRRSAHLGALILAVYDGDDLLHCGQVGTGFDEATLRSLRRRLDELVTAPSALHSAPQTTEPATWVRTVLVCEVRHAGWTKQGILRHPAYIGLREDVAPKDCVREEAAPVDAVLAVADMTSSARGSRSSRSSTRRAGRRGRAAPDGAAVDELLGRLAELGDSDTIDVDGHPVRLTHLDKLMWPDDGLTKRDLIAHYIRVGPVLMPYLRDRPLSMQIFPDGIDGNHFWRKDKPSHAPAWMQSWTYHGEKTKEYIVVNNLATLVWVANAASIDLHPWHSRIDAPQQPDWAVFDLDPAEGASFESVLVIARLIAVALEHYALHSVLKTTGQTGLQIYVPIRRGPNYAAVRAWVEGVSRAVGSTVPDLVSWEWSVRQRTGRVRIDYTQNIINKTLNAPYTVRAVTRAPVSAPIAWDELDDPLLRPDRWTVRTLAERLAQTGDLFRVALAGDQDLPPLD